MRRRSERPGLTAPRREPVVPVGPQIALALETQDALLLFEAVRSRIVEVGDCWIWQGGTTAGKNPYGYLQLPGGKQVRIHRSVALANNGFRKWGLEEVVHHKCAKTLCVNPDHLLVWSEKENSLEGHARQYLTERIEELTRARDLLTGHVPELNEKELRERAQINQVDQLRPEKGSKAVRRDALKAALELVGLTKSTYERRRLKYFPERVNGESRLGLLEKGIRWRDHDSIAQYLADKMPSEQRGDDCWLWPGKKTNGYPTAGVGVRHRYLRRVLMWATKGFRGELSHFPDVWHDCDQKLCLNPDHLRLITQHFDLIYPPVLEDRLTTIRRLLSEIAALDPSHAKLTDNWEYYLKEAGYWPNPSD